jgi:hypothetical protein
MTNPLDKERERFETVNRHIVETERRIDMERSRILRYQDRGHPTGPSEMLLASLRNSLAIMFRYRQQILRNLVDLKRARRPSRLAAGQAVQATQAVQARQQDAAAVAHQENHEVAGMAGRNAALHPFNADP